MTKPIEPTLAEGIRQWVEICLLQIEQRKLEERQSTRLEEEKSNTEVEALET